MSARPTPALRILAGLAAGSAAFLINLRPIELFPRAPVLMGQFLVLAAAVLGGPVAGGLAALLGALPTVHLWGHVFGLAILVLEGVVVGHFSRRHLPIVVDGIFWLLAPVYFLLAYRFSMHMSLLTTTVVWGKQALNSVMAALLLQVALMLPPVRRPLRFWLPTSLHAVRLRTAIATALAVAASIPLFLQSGAEGWRYHREELARLEEHEMETARLVAHDVERSLHDAQREVDVLASRVTLGSRGGELPPPEVMRELVQDMKSFSKHIVFACISDSSGSPLVMSRPDGQGQLSEQERAFVLKSTGSPLPQVSGVFEAPGRAGRVLVSIPIRDPEHVLGFAVAALQPSGLTDVTIDPDEHVQVADANRLPVLEYPGAPAVPTEADVAAAAPEAGRARPERAVGLAEVSPEGWSVTADTSAQVTQASTERSMLGLLASIFLAVAVVVLGSAVVARSLAAPLQQLAQAASGIASGADGAGVRIGLEDAPLEVVELSENFDTMAAAVHRHISEIEQTSQEKDVFLSVASHELRTPLTALKARLDLLLRRAGPADRARLDPISRQVGQLTRLMAQLLDASRLQRGMVELNRKRVDLASVIRRVAEPLVAASPRHRLELRLNAVAGDLDEVQLEQVMHNLVSNALKYSPDGGPVEISLREVDGEAEIEVADRGIGVPVATEEFGRFERGDVQGIAGLGIGLHVTQEIVRAHGGRLKLSPRPGGGSAAVAHLPLRAPA